MDRVFRYAAYLTGIIQVLFVLTTLPELNNSSDIMSALFLLLLPVLAMVALYTGPDIEERRLHKQVNKARLRAELETLEKKK